VVALVDPKVVMVVPVEAQQIVYLALLGAEVSLVILYGEVQAEYQFLRVGTVVVAMEVLLLLVLVVAMQAAC
jgi:hypothetical protein